jgi:hypothetical protein
MRIESIPGGNTEKFIPHLFHQLNVERRAARADP